MLLMIFAITNCATTQPLTPTIQLQQDLNLMLEWFPGEYDNDQQIRNQIQNQTPKDLQHRHTHHLFQPVEIGFIDQPTLYAQQYQHYDPNDLYRQRFYAFDIDTNEKAIRLTIYTPKNPADITNIHLNAEKQKQLQPDEFILKPGCEVFWKRKSDGFHGYLKANACSYFSERFGKRVYLNETLILRKDALILHDTAVDANGAAVFGSADKGPTVNIKQ